MTTKSITITSEAYERLASCKEPRESFSDVVNKLTKRYSIRDLVGLLSNEEASELTKHIKESQKRMRQRINIISEEL